MSECHRSSNLSSMILSDISRRDRTESFVIKLLISLTSGVSYTSINFVPQFDYSDASVRDGGDAGLVKDSERCADILRLQVYDPFWLVNF